MALEPLELEKSALLVIDLQNGFCHEDGTLGQSGLDVGRISAVIPTLRSVIEQCRAAGMPVLWTLQEHFQTDRRRARKALQPHTAKRKGVVALAGTWDAAIVDELADLADDPSLIIRKHRFGGFYETRLDIVLEQLGIQHLFVTGATTNACVETTVREAYLRDYDVIAIEDCIAGVRPEWEATALEVWRQYFAITCSAEELRDWLNEQRAPKTRYVHHLLLMVSDLERTRDFYVDMLGFDQRKDAKPLPDGREFIAFKQGLGITSGGPGDSRQMDHLAFEVRNVKALNTKLKEAGVPYERELGPGPYGLAIYVRDPDGNILELFETE
ncbi:MAG: isochorismatase family protein [Gammaproteobacteria bacterium]|nr:isochorismatase family protein [Gammaproteobacteria bacterium]NNM00681.1 isochorismatase family protein [Gammaproteobacteria bacterium]